MRSGLVRTICFCCLLPAVPAAAQDVLPVQILAAKPEARTIDFQVAGTIEAPDTIAAGFRDGGRVLSVAVDAGARVKAGDEIARVDPTQAEAARDAAQAALAGAEAALTEAQSNQARVQARLEGGVATRAELDSANQQLAGAEATRDQSAASLSKAARAVEDTVLRAPQDAIVTDRSAEAGQVVGPGQTVVTLASDLRREAVFYAPGSVDLESFLGHDLMLALLDDPSVTLDAKISEVSPVVDAATGTVRVKAEIPKVPEGDPLLGAPVVGHLKIELPVAIHLPWDALTASAKGPAVWTVDPGTMSVALTPVGIESYGETEVTIESGLTNGQLVVGAGSQLLYPGRKVEKAAP